MRATRRTEGKTITTENTGTEITADTADGAHTTIVDTDTHVAPTFAELGVSTPIVDALTASGKTHTFAIQELTLPLALAGEDLIGQARTGMGKTFGFGVPLLHRVSQATEPNSAIRPVDGTPRALIIVPTRELCVQVTSDLATAAAQLQVHPEGKDARPLSILSIYGGRPYEAQIEELRAGVDVVVGTPGRLLDLAQQGHLILGKVQILVLDEADEMLDLGFLPDIERIMGALPEKRQTMLFSATMPGPIVTLARTFLHRPTHIRAEHAHDSAVHERTTQFVYRAHAMDKAELVARVLQATDRGATMIFTRTKRTAQRVADDLLERGFKVGAVHGDLGQVAREKALGRFRDGKIDVLVATDVAARGIDIDDVTHVINYQCPDDEKTYVHRIGRTGRAGRTGTAITLVDWDELHRWEQIDKALGLGKPEPVETYSSSDHLRSDLDIPETANGRNTSSKPSTEATAKREPRERRAPRADRQRRRTRGGQSAASADASATSRPKSASTDSTANDSHSAQTDGADAPKKRRRRRRSSGPGSSGTGGAAAAPTPAQHSTHGDSASS